LTHGNQPYYFFKVTNYNELPFTVTKFAVTDCYQYLYATENETFTVMDYNLDTQSFYKIIHIMKVVVFGLNLSQSSEYCIFACEVIHYKFNFTFKI